SIVHTKKNRWEIPFSTLVKYADGVRTSLPYAMNEEAAIEYSYLLGAPLSYIATALLRTTQEVTDLLAAKGYIPACYEGSIQASPDVLVSVSSMLEHKDVTDSITPEDLLKVLCDPSLNLSDLKGFDALSEDHRSALEKLMTLEEPVREATNDLAYFVGEGWHKDPFENDREVCASWAAKWFLITGNPRSALSCVKGDDSALYNLLQAFPMETKEALRDRIWHKMSFEACSAIFFVQNKSMPAFPRQIRKYLLRKNAYTEAPILMMLANISSERGHYSVCDYYRSGYYFLWPAIVRTYLSFNGDLPCKKESDDHGMECPEIDDVLEEGRHVLNLDESIGREMAQATNVYYWAIDIIRQEEEASRPADNPLEDCSDLSDGIFFERPPKIDPIYEACAADAEERASHYRVFVEDFITSWSEQEGWEKGYDVPDESSG
ncbi:hypothetical protein LRF89_12875, partial [Halorhodospira sp. 9621]|uniref:hypothetical protein n=1 Tax=Halorhodospira sp. 9621 TaxID=2899135 RepID=UPI001EE79F90